MIFHCHLYRFQHKPFLGAFYLAENLRNITRSPCRHSLLKPRRTFGRIREQMSENPRSDGGFSPAREFSQTFLRFSPDTDLILHGKCAWTIFIRILKRQNKNKRVFERVSVLMQSNQCLLVSQIGRAHV